MPDYSKAKIYKLVCNVTGEVYFGSTCVGLSQRLQKHKDCFRYGGRCSSKQIIERGNYNIILCQECPCENKEQLKAFERKWIEENECINVQLPGRTKKEWYEKNRIEILKTHKEWHDEHKGNLKDKKREYYEQNKIEILKKNKEWLDQHEEQKKQYHKQRACCPTCGKEMLKYGIKKHLRNIHGIET
jgi:hypothetical protein